jgi:hypothetical protein
MPDGGAGKAYGALIADQLAEERNRKASLEARGVTIITTSGTLVTALFALTEGLSAAAELKLPGHAKLALILALGAFVLAAIAGLATNFPLRYKEPTPNGLAKLVDTDYWTAAAEIGQIRVAAAEITILAVSRSANSLKAALLLVGISFELLAVIFLSWAVGSILYGT